MSLGFLGRNSVISGKCRLPAAAAFSESTLSSKTSVGVGGAQSVVVPPAPSSTKSQKMDPHLKQVKPKGKSCRKSDDFELEIIFKKRI